MTSIAWFSELDKNSIAVAGGKGANLGEMTKAKFPIPGGFVVTAQAYKGFVERTSIQPQIMALLKDLDVNDTEKLQDTSRRIADIMRSAPVPQDIRDDIAEAYQKMCTERRDQVYVACRSSATAEDLPEASFAGQQATFLDIQSDTEVIKAVRKCWASLFTPRAIFYRTQQGFSHDKVYIAVVVQEMVKSESAGVMFTSEPTGDTSKLIIEAAYGLGEAVVSGAITPDTYIMQKEPLKLLTKKIGEQQFKIVRNERNMGTTKVELSISEKKNQKLSDDKITALAEMGKTIEAHYGAPQDIEWALQKGELLILQSRAITTLDTKKEVGAELQGEELIRGLAASPGVGKGIVKIVHDVSELSKVEQGDILVTKMTDPDMVPAMKKAAAIVTNEGGLTCHAAIVSRELDVPCIVGTSKITDLVKDGDQITVDADRGIVYKGIIGSVVEEKEEVQVGEAPKTRTHVYLNLGIPEKAEEYAKLPVDGVGLMREEFIIATEIKEHPLKLMKEGRGNVFVEKLVDGISRVCAAFHPRPVVLRLSDFKTNEYRGLVGGEEFEEKEDNPMLGWRGCSRYYSPEYKEAFKLELQAVKKVREKHDNLWVMLPFVRTVAELHKVEAILREEGLQRGEKFKLWLMAEIPANALLAEEFASHCDGFSIGSNDLTQLVLGVDRDSEKLGNMGLFDEKNDAVKKAIQMIVEGAKKKGKTVSICGQAPSNYPEFTKFLVSIGIDSVSVNHDAVVKTRRVIAEAEGGASGDKKDGFKVFGFKLWGD